MLVASSSLQALKRCQMLDDTRIVLVSQTNEGRVAGNRVLVRDSSCHGLQSPAGVWNGAAPERRLSWHGNADALAASSSGKVFLPSSSLDTLNGASILMPPLKDLGILSLSLALPSFAGFEEVRCLLRNRVGKICPA